MNVYLYELAEELCMPMIEVCSEYHQTMRNFSTKMAAENSQGETISVHEIVASRAELDHAEQILNVGSCPTCPSRPETKKRIGWHKMLARDAENSYAVNKVLELPSS